MLFIVSTAVKVGKGGISSALVGFTQSKVLRDYGFRAVSSHSERDKKRRFLSAYRTLRNEVTAKDTAWLHCGPWLSLFRKWLLARAVKRAGGKVIYHFHSAKMEAYLLSPVGRFFIRAMLRNADGIAVLTPWWQRLFERKLGALPCPIAVIGNPLGVELEGIAHQPVSIKPPEGQITLLAMARLLEKKGVADVVHALKALPNNYVLLVAGSGPQEDDLKQLVKKLKLNERVSFLGWVDYDKKLAVIEKANIFCLPSRYDSFGMGFIEAMAAGLPVVALRQGAVPDVVLDGETGILVNDASPSTLAKAIELAYANRVELAKNGKQHVLRNYLSEKLAESFIQFNESIVRQAK
ncbi:MULTISPECIES: glycosyltransferase family 4 protein [Pseudidiomarina]|uniref:Glycosyl transferase family 1 domain-containing protein n=1 Tax=Pseudidiomarina homiensis TaxID=364198 RepID=A0A432Y5T5_9GAMM|nr:MULTISPECIES: glycosyltransferase family 4 protein [Pseudidiomarina]RUO56251.1 hypothetical protein CWI70_05735 [Pseudidiomarina homiensis]